MNFIHRNCVSGPCRFFLVFSTLLIAALSTFAGSRQDDLIKELGHRKADKRLAAAQELARYEEPQVVETLAQALSDKDARVRGQAASSLWKLADIAGPAESALRAVLHDPELGVRVRAAGALVAQGVDESELAATFRSVLASERSYYRFLAARGLIGLEPGPALLPHLLEYGRGQAGSRHNMELVEKAIVKLARTQDPSLIAPIVAALTERSPLNTIALGALSRFEPKPADYVEILLRCLSDKRLQNEALRLLGERTASADEVSRWVPEVTRVLKESGARRVALRALAKAGGLAEQSFPQVLELLAKDKNSDTREQVAKTLGSIGDHKQAIPMNRKVELANQAKPVLTRAIETDRDSSVRKAAIGCLMRLQLEPVEVVPVLEKAAVEDSDERVILAALRGLRDFEADARSAAPSIERLLDHPSPGVQRTAEGTLASVRLDRKLKRERRVEKREVVVKDPESEKRGLETLRRLGVKFEGRPFELSVKERQINVIEAFLDAGMSPNHQFSRLSFTPLHTLFDHACKTSVRPTPEKVKTVARILLGRGADPNQLSAGAQNSPLVMALWNCDPAVVQMLLEAGADPSVKNSFGQTAVVSAVQYAAGMGGDGYEALIEKGHILSPEEAKQLLEIYKDDPKALKLVSRMSP